MANNSLSQQSLTKKIDVLLSAAGTTPGQQDSSEKDNRNGQLVDDMPYGPERHLVAWVLLTRLEQDNLDEIWKKYGSTILEPYAISYLLRHDHDNNTKLSSSSYQSKPNLPTSRGLYLRLVAQVMSRLSNSFAWSKFDYNHHNNASTPPIAVSQQKEKSTSLSLGVALIQEWKKISEENCRSNSDKKNTNAQTASMTLAVHLDVLKAFEAWMEYDPTVAERLKLLELIWNHFDSLNSILISETADGNADIPSAIVDTKANEMDADGTSPSTTTKTVENVDGNSKSLSDWELMALTLDGILQSDNTIDSVVTMDGCNSLILRWHEQIFALFQSFGNEVLPDTMVPNVIEWMTNANNLRSLATDVRQGWHEWLLTMIQTRIPYDQAFRLQVFQQNGYKTLAQLNQLLLAHVVSPLHNELNASLRALAWQTMITLVDACGWQWVLMVTTAGKSSTDPELADALPPSSRLGMASNLCTWIRLASGEWQIQLQAISSNSGHNASNSSMADIPLSSDHKHATKRPFGLSSQHSASSESTAGNAGAGIATAATSPGWQQATALPVGNACARLLIGVVHFCVKLEEQQHHPQRKMPQLSVDALFHLRVSLQTSLFTTVEYLQLQYQEQQLADSWSDYEKPALRSSISSASPSSFETIAVRLLGTLLMEIDIWLLQPPVDDIAGGNGGARQANDGADSTTTSAETVEMIRSVLGCLQNILPESQDYSLLPGIVSVLAGAESAAVTDPQLVASVMTEFWDPLVDYLEGYWQRDSTAPVNSRSSAAGNSGEKLNDTVAWACSCTEMYVSLDDTKTSATTKHRHRRLALSLIEWIQTVLQVDSQQLWSPTSTPPSFRPSRSPGSSPSFSSPRSSKRRSSTSKLTLHKLQSYLSLAVGCYMTLSKNSEQPPREHESRVIFRALQVCEMQPQGMSQQPPPPPPAPGSTQRQEL